LWTSGSRTITIQFSAKDAGGTDIAIVFASQ